MDLDYASLKQRQRAELADRSVNRDQLRDCSAFLGKLVPFVIKLMMDNPDTLWGDACYPVVESN